MDLFEKLPSFCKASEITVYDCGDGVFMQIFDGADEEYFFEYKKQLESSGFVVTQRHNIAGNIHFTLSDGNITVQYYYNPCSGNVRLVADDYTSHAVTVPENFEKVCNTELFQFETDHSLIDCGMCYIIRCADNSFFVIDSAHFYSIHDNDRIHDFLRSMTPADEKIRISGWFISHGHEDHICKCKDYLLYNMADTVIDRIYFNFISDMHRDNANWDDSGKGFRRSFYRVVEESGIPVVKLHSGQHFYVKNLEFEVLCTHEDVYPASCADYNNSSTVLMMTAENTRVLFPGDASNESSKVLEERYGEYLKCDIVQLSHHGHNGTSAKFYEYAAAPVVLCPNTEIKFNEEWHRFYANEVAHDIADEFYISANGTVKLTLPYVKGSAEVFADETTENFDGIKQLWNYDYTDEFKQKHNEEFMKRGGKL